MKMCHFRAQNDPFVLDKIIYGTNHYYYFHLPIGHFHCAKFKKNLTAMRMCHFWAQNGPLPPAPPQNFFLVQTIIITFTHLLALFNVQNFKKILQRIQSYDTPFLGPKWSLPPQVFFGKLLISFSSTY